MEPKPATESITVMNEIVLPSDTNALGTAFGGKVIQWIDICAAIAAQRHCQKRVVTASIDAVHFHAPIRVGMVAALEARVNATFQKSLETEVTVHGEDPVSGHRERCCSAFLTFTALDEDFKPTTVPPLLLVTEDDKTRSASAEKRREFRLRQRSMARPSTPETALKRKGDV